MLLAFTCPEESAPITVSPTGRRHASRATSAYDAMITKAAIADTGRSAEKSVRTSAWASTTNSRNGDSTKNVSRASTGRACSPSRSMRPMIQPTTIATPTTTNPVSDSSMIRA